MTEVPTITLNDGNKMPLLGLGVFPNTRSWKSKTNSWDGVS